MLKFYVKKSFRYKLIFFYLIFFRFKNKKNISNKKNKIKNTVNNKKKKTIEIKIHVCNYLKNLYT